ncbi:hypothetical protein [Aestuariibaculum suncheonense]|uniref:Uncharacterized protein n=1 Tax=Aestuariibaculum suncheonense TaxID=1028745 RepID=A0A8J6UB80_9FLAO|nr:hypothetical protein [Aestuariibaculum suncheonense]MBD0835650.1 hypothetical protein [Aestuariibaculum suncheonense]
MKKVFATCLLVIGLSLSSIAQTDKIKETANEKTNQLNTEIIAGDKSQGLTDAQKGKIYQIHITRLEALKQAKKNGANNDDLKEINQIYFKKIYKDILTKEQVKARGKYKKENN